MKIKTEPGTEGVAFWKVRSNLAPLSPTDSDDDEENKQSRKVTPSRDVLTLDVLPYLTKIKTARKEDTKTLIRITHFTGSSVQIAGDEPDDDEPGVEDEAIVAAKKISMGSRFAPQSTGKGPVKSFGSPMKAAGAGVGVKRESTTSTEALEMERLFLEDDDIQDD